MFLSKYAYARVTFYGETIDGTPVEAVVGVEIDRNRESVREMYAAIRSELNGVRPLLDIAEDENIAITFERVVRSKWPERSFFLEIGRGDLNEWVQVFEPKSMHVYK